MNANLEFSRRDMLQSAGALIVAFSTADAGAALAQMGMAAAEGRRDLIPTELDSWIAIAPDGKVTIFFGKIDCGQGTDMAIAQICAEEMDVAISDVSVVMGDSGRTVNQGGASGSTGVRFAGNAFKQAGAEARRVLVARAAERLGVPPDSITVTDGVASVAGDASKKVTYAELIRSTGGRFNSQIGWNKQYGNPLALTSPAKPKSPDQYKLVGTSPPRFDVAGRVYGTKPFTSDIRVEGMLHGRMLRPRVAGAVPVAVDESSIAGIPGARVVRKADFIGVVAPKEWDAVLASQKLQVTWSNVPDPFPAQADLYDHIRNAPITKRDGPAEVGNVEAAFARAARVVQAEYEWPFQSHASMGPACAVADVRADTATVWTGTQKPHFAAQCVAKLLNLPIEKVRAIWVTGPGSYGRNDAGDVTMDATILSQAVGRPVRVQYMRYEGLGWDPKAPASIHRARAALDAQNNVIAYDFLSRGFSRIDANSSEADPGDTLAGMLLGYKRAMVQAFNLPEAAYEFENKRLAWECVPPLLVNASPLRTSHMRDPVGPQITFASESFVDELAFAVRSDPIEFRLRYMKSPRDIAVIKAAAERAGWKSGPSGTRRTQNGNVVAGRGFAYAQRGGTLVAVIADVEVNQSTGAVRTRRFTVAHDCGLIINPDTLRRVIEANVIQGMSRTIREEVQFDRKNVLSVDWRTYPIADIGEIPDAIDIVLLNHPESQATGAGEGSTRPIAAAIGNAIFEATGQRLRRAPLSPERIRASFA